MTGPSDVLDIRAGAWMNERPSREEAERRAEDVVSLWKQEETSLPVRPVPRSFGVGKPIYESDLGQLQYVLLVARDGKADLAGFAVIAVRTGFGSDSWLSGTVSEGQLEDPETGESLEWSYELDRNGNGGEIAVRGVSEEQPAFVAVYDVYGKMVSVQVIQSSGDRADVSAGTAARIFWVSGETNAPKTENARINLAG